MSNFFNIFQIKESPIIDKKELLSKYLELQALAHPDNGVDDDFSSVLNNAYQVLSDTYKVLEYFFELNNIDLNIDLGDEFMFELLEEKEGLSKQSEDKKISLEKENEKILLECFKNIEKNNLKDAAVLYVKLKYKKELLN